MKIGFIGLGTMGGPMASSLAAAGHQLYVNDLRTEAMAPHISSGAIAKPTAREIGEAAEVVFTSLPGPVEFQDVAIGPNGLIHGMKPGTYAVSLVHDENANGKLDTKAMIPGEGFGFSRNPMILFGPPSFGGAKFTLDANGGAQAIKMKYML